MVLMLVLLVSTSCPVWQRVGKTEKEKQKSCESDRVIDFKWFNFFGVCELRIHRQWQTHISFFSFPVTFDWHQKPLQPSTFRWHLCFTSWKVSVPLSSQFLIFAFRWRPLNETRAENFKFIVVSRASSSYMCVCVWLLLINNVLSTGLLMLIGACMCVCADDAKQKYRI